MEIQPPAKVTGATPDGWPSAGRLRHEVDAALSRLSSGEESRILNTFFEAKAATGFAGLLNTRGAAPWDL